MIQISFCFLSHLNFFFYVFFVYHWIYFYFFFCSFYLCRCFCLFLRYRTLLVFSLNKIKITLAAVSGEVPVFTTVEASFWSISKISSWSSVVSPSKSIITIPSSSEASSISVSVSSTSAHVSAAFTSGKFNFDLFVINGFSVHTKLSYRSKIEKS